ncbi:hypothetical protein H5410_047314 [Solanum commersonii]|uniref:Uncharacterized protein n=1 Tax=Solanum commersonii TaxID=4109 RepID=A0A9J5XIS7_SOLCO|nr:hypothetical protein H5410_047314 [Solanum commersonii]
MPASAPPCVYLKEHDFPLGVKSITPTSAPKEAESHLPKLESRDGISIAMEDIVTSRVWNMKFWPNNKSRMYVLEKIVCFKKNDSFPFTK